MGKITGFLEYERNDRHYQPVEERIRHWREFMLPLSEQETRTQAARCMDCGIPYCHTGCPVNNQIPDWNDLVWRGNWAAAARNLHSTNNFPEVTGRVCPAPCEGSCPAGLACAQQLARAGHAVHVFEKLARPGGLLVYGIPDFKMEKHYVEARVKQMQAEGVTFHCGAHVGVSVATESLLEGHHALVLAGGAEKARDLPIPGRELAGIHFAMDFLPQQNRRVSGERDDSEPILATGKHVVVIGGGDTGSDCIGTSIRQGALSVTNFEIMPAPPLAENKLVTWPDWPLKMRTSSSHEEGAERDFAVLTKKFSGEGNRVSRLHCVRVDGKIAALGLELDARGNVKADMTAYASSLPKVFACGDMRRGQSLVVWAIREGRQCAHAVDKFLMGETTLPR